MAEILIFSRNKCIYVEDVGDSIIKATCKVQDTFGEGYIEIKVRSPDLEIVEVHCNISYADLEPELEIAKYLEKLVGSRIGPGIRKIIRGILGDSKYSEFISSLLEECLNGVILSFTKDVLSSAPVDPEGEREFFANMVRANPRLYNSCAALSQESPLMEGIRLDGIKP